MIRRHPATAIYPTRAVDGRCPWHEKEALDPDVEPGGQTWDLGNLMCTHIYPLLAVALWLYSSASLSFSLFIYGNKTWPSYLRVPYGFTLKTDV